MRRTRPIHSYFAIMAISLMVPLLAAIASSCSKSPGATSTADNATPTNGALVIVANPTPAPFSTVRPIPSLTPTSTPIHATEVSTPTAKSPVNDESVWQGSILSDSSRQYFSNGSPVNLCQTSWSMNLTFVVKPDESVIGDGTASLTKPRTCSSSSDMAPNVSDYTVKVSGSKGDSEFDLQLRVTSFKPDGTGESGGFNELFIVPRCNPTPTRRTVVIPLSNATEAKGALDLADTMTGCAGSGDDVMKDKSNYDLRMITSCAGVSADSGDPEIVKLCQ